jgi:excisionase family DNA binding protein
MPKKSEPEFLTPEEVAEILKMDTKNVLNLLRKGEIEGFKVGKFWRIKKEVVAKMGKLK